MRRSHVANMKTRRYQRVPADHVDDTFFILTQSGVPLACQDGEPLQQQDSNSASED